MAAQSGNPGGGSPRLRLFLVAGVRVVGVLLALGLTGNHHDYSNPPPEILQQMPAILTTAVLLYHACAGYLSFRAPARGLLALLILFMDTMMGVGLTYYFGPAYLVLGFTLPVLSTALHYGTGGALMSVVLGGIFYGVILGFSLVGRLETADVSVFFRLTGAQGAVTILLLWLYAICVGEGEDRARVEERSRQEKDLLFQEIQAAKSEVGQMYGEVAERENAIMALKRELDGAREELEGNYKRLHEARLAVQATEKLAEDQGREVAQQSRREKMQLQRQLARLQKKFERQTRLTGVFRQVSSSLALSETLLAITEQIQALLPCQSCVIFMVDEVEGHRELFAEVAASPYTDLFRNFSLQIGEGAPGHVASKLKPLKIDVGSVSLDGTTISTVVPEEKSALVAPLATQGDVLGTVYLGRPKENAFTDEDLETLADFCELASISLGNAILFQRTVSHGIHDPMTPLYNSLYLEERMREEVKRGRRYTYPVSLILMDLDGFGEVNQTLGQEAGDAVLRGVGEVLRSNCRETDVMARLEGDDFAVLVVHSDRNSAFNIAERVRKVVEDCTFGRGPRKVRITASFGVAGIPHDAVNEEQLTMRATAALQQARSAGGNTVSFWSGSGS